MTNNQTTGYHIEREEVTESATLDRLEVEVKELARHLTQIFIIDRQGRYVYASPGAAQEAGQSQDFLIGKTWRDLGIPLEICAEVEEYLRRAFEAGDNFTGTVKASFSGVHKEYELETMPLRSDDGKVSSIMVVFTDRTEAKRAHRFSSALNRINAEINPILAPQELLHRVVVEASKEMEGDAMGVFLRDEGGWTVQEVCGLPQQLKGRVISKDQAQLEESIVGSRRPMRIDDVLGHEVPIKGPLVECGVRSLMGLPLMIKGEVIGILMFFRLATPRPYHDEELDFGLKLAASVSLALENARLYEEMNRMIERSRVIMDSTHTNLVLLDRDLRAVMINEGFARTKQAMMTDTIGRNILEMFSSEEERRMFTDAMKNGTPVEIKERPITSVRHPEWPVSYWDISFTPVRGPGGEVEGAVLSTINVTDRVRAAEERTKLLQDIDSQRLLLQSIVDNIPMAMAVLKGMDLDVKWANDSFRRSFITHFPDVNTSSMKLKDVLHPHEWKYASEVHHGILESGKAYTNPEFERTFPDGSIEYWSFKVVPFITTPDGMPEILFMAANITDLVRARKRIEELARQAEEERGRLRTIMDSLPVGVFIVDTQGKTVGSNEIRDRIWGGKVPVTRDVEGLKEYRGWWADTGIKLGPRDWPVFKAITTGEPIEGEVIDIQRFDGTRGTEIVSASPIRDTDGKIVGAVGVMHDITRHRQLEHDAVEAKERSELYIDLLTHDINNMNASIAGYVQLAQEALEMDKAKAKLEKALSVVKESSRLIDNVIKIQKVETQEVGHTLIDLGWLLEDVRGEFEHIPGREVSIGYQPAIKKFVVANELLRDVFSNILGNAIRHSKGPLTIDIALTKAFEDGREFYKVIIEDNGPGISDEEKRRIFLKKVRGKTKASGSGLGLYLVKRLVEDFNGRVWVEDRVPGDSTNGAKFVVMLPIASSSSSIR